MSKKMRVVFCVAAMLVMACAFSACSGANTSQQAESSNEAEASQQDASSQSEDASAQSNIDSLYQESVFGDIMIEYPSDWKAVENDGVVTMSADGSGGIPFITVEKVGAATPPDKYVAIQTDAFRNRYGNQMAKPPEIVTTTVAGMELVGFTAKYSAEDASATIAHEEYAEVIGDTLYNFTCEYVCSDSETQHEDETTPFAFMHVIESMKVKSE